jgi:hypothetical protein
MRSTIISKNPTNEESEGLSPLIHKGTQEIENSPPKEGEESKGDPAQVSPNVEKQPTFLTV